MKKKVLVCSAKTPFMYGGAEIHAENLRCNLEKRGFDTELINVPFKWYPNERLITECLIWNMLDLNEANGQKIDLVIPLKFPSYFVQHHNKVTWLMHQHRPIYDLYGTKYSDFDMNNGFHRKIRDELIRLDEKALLESRKIFANSKNVSGRLKKYNKIDSEPLYHPPKNVGKYYNDEAGNYILSVGRLDPLKRVDIVIKSLKFCNKDIYAIIAGTGGMENELRELAEREGVSDRVKFTGFVTDEELIKLYAQSLAIIFPPVDEDYGYITIESFLSKKPVLTAADSGGSLEFVKNNENGFICDSAESFGAKMNWLYENKSIAKEMGMQGYEVVKDISWDNVVDKLTESIR
ncbi:hypothetical protein HMPREF1084_03410 [Clostridium butyricum 60E.3]|uniref:glycosyltransferase family 4 protein n=1 Tax=Clostridium butyricum TaxID=1492 RepID=UPI0002D20936|nr:glycosyltransferase family 4 protein [Clostridium butyricum]ENZ30837.1 hypothetical protein HMPREF1084_03410 [Clostridium butyricum 60E.3]